MEKWSENIHNYTLSNEYTLEKANLHEFAVCEVIYGDGAYKRNPAKSWDLQIEGCLKNPFIKSVSAYWIKCGSIKIGGVIMEPNALSSFFVIPPFEKIFDVLKLLKKLLVHWSSTNKNIDVYKVDPNHNLYFEMLGFRTGISRRWMLRPTEVFDISWGDTILVRPLEQGQNVEMAQLFHDACLNNIDYYYDTYQDGEECNMQFYQNLIYDYFLSKPNDQLLEASSLVYDRTNNRLIGACLISLYDEWPLVYDISVHPSYRGSQLASKMLKKALTVLHTNYPLLRLYVTIGNGAQSVYYKLGFVSGVESKRFYIPVLNAY